MRELWKPVKGYEGFYEVSSLGRVKSLPRKYSPNETVMKPLYHKSGYESVDLRKPNHPKKHFLVHRLLMLSFIPNPENKTDVNHIDSDRKNNRLDNLEWVTRKENLHHAHSKGRMTQWGKDQKINNAIREDIRHRVNIEGEKQKDLAKEYKVSNSLVCRIINF